MSALPRVGMLALLLVAAFAVPTAAASDCIAVETDYFGEGLRVLANTGRQLAFGIISGDPGDGIAAIVIITPGACGPLGFNTSTSTSDAGTLLGQDVEGTIHSVPSYLPLP